jgi:hypothetical protein
MKTFIRVAEVWTPSPEGSLLEWAGGVYGAAPAFGAVSRTLCFGRGEGLPGRAWDEGQPILLRKFEGSYFRRTAIAREAGLNCAVALPIFRGEALTSVVVLLCGEPDAHAGAIELWHNNPRLTTDLTLADGYFGSNGAELEALSRDAYLPRGAGLPGLAWQRESAVFMDQIDHSSRFLRAQTAASAGIVRALAVPCSTRSNASWVLSLLSSSSTPIARRVESWLPDDAGQALQRAFGFCESAGTLAADGASLTSGDGPIGQAFATGIAVALDPLTTPPAGAPGLSAVLAIPLLAEGAVTEVLALYF